MGLVLVRACLVFIPSRILCLIYASCHFCLKLNYDCAENQSDCPCANLFTTVCFYSYNIDWTSFCNDDVDDISNEMAGIYSAILFTITRTSKICLFCEPINRWNECKLDVELCWILSGEDRNFAILQLYWSETYSI